jgi:hypothetical protein
VVNLKPKVKSDGSTPHRRLARFPRAVRFAMNVRVIFERFQVRNDLGWYSQLFRQTFFEDRCQPMRLAHRRQMRKHKMNFDGLPVSSLRKRRGSEFQDRRRLRPASSRESSCPLRDLRSRAARRRSATPGVRLTQNVNRYGNGDEGIEGLVQLSVRTCLSSASEMGDRVGQPTRNK